MGKKRNLDFDSLPYAKINLKGILCLSVRATNTALVEENRGENLKRL